jgi:ribose 5-phosphate isomerase B
MKVALGCDHAGFDLRQHVADWIRAAGHEVLDRGPVRLDPDDDYPDAAAAVGRAVAQGDAERGVLLCGSGVGASVAANKIRGVRAGLCHDTYSARQGVEHDDINVLCLGARVIGEALARELVGAFLAARFSGEARHRRRLRKIEALERGGG